MKSLLTSFFNINIIIYLLMSCSSSNVAEKSNKNIDRTIARYKKYSKGTRSTKSEDIKKNKGNSFVNSKKKSESKQTYSIEYKLTFLEEKGVNPIKIEWRKVLKEMGPKEKEGFYNLVNKLYDLHLNDATAGANLLKLKVLKEYVGDVRGKKRRKKINELEKKLCCLFNSCKVSK
jgi:hypothetical protein